MLKRPGTQQDNPEYLQPPYIPQSQDSFCLPTSARVL